MEEFLKEEREEETIRIAAIALKSGYIKEEKLKEIFKFTKKQMKAIKEKVAVLV